MANSGIVQLPVKVLSDYGKTQENNLGSFSSAVWIEWGSDSEFVLDLDELYKNEKIAAPQSIFIAGARAGDTIEFQQFNLAPDDYIKYKMPDYSQGWFPFPAGHTFKIKFTRDPLDGASGLSVILSSLACPSNIWDLEPYVSQGNITGHGGVWDSGVFLINSDTSTPYIRGNKSVLGFYIDDLPIGTELEILGSIDNTNYFSLFNAAGQKAVIDVTLGLGLYKAEDYYDFELVNRIKIKSNAVETFLSLDILSEDFSFNQYLYS